MAKSGNGGNEDRGGGAVIGFPTGVDGICFKKLAFCTYKGFLAHL